MVVPVFDDSSSSSSFGTVSSDEDIAATKLELAQIIQKQDGLIQELEHTNRALASKDANVVIFQIIRYTAVAVFLGWMTVVMLPWAERVIIAFAPVHS